MSLCRAVPALLVLAASPAAYAVAQTTLEKSAELRIPPYSAQVLEITPERLDRFQATLESAPDLVAVRKERDQAHQARRSWQDCQRGVKGSHQASGQRAEKAMEGNKEELQKLGAETERRLKNAKSQEEVQQIIAEMTAKQQALSAPAQDANAAYGQDLSSKCGPEPSTEPANLKVQEAERQRDAKLKELPAGFGLMRERVTVYCSTPMKYVGPDGAVSTSDSPFRLGDKGSMHYNSEVYSPKEAALLKERCGRIKPLLISRGLAGE